MIKPDVKITGDTLDRIIWNHGELVSKTRDRALWRFGFIQHCELANKYGVYTESFVWVFSHKDGSIIESFEGYFYNLPQKIQNWSSIHPADPKILAEYRKYKKTVQRIFKRDSRMELERN